MAETTMSVKKNLTDNGGNLRDITSPIELLSNTNNLAKSLAAEILSGRVEDAKAILEKCGCNAFIPGTNYGTQRSIADYYHVTKSYVVGIFNKYHISYPVSSIVVREYPSVFLSKYGSGKCGYRMYDQTFYWIDGSDGQRKSMSARGQYYDARAILAFACLATRSRQISETSMANQIMAFIQDSKYMQLVNDKYTAEKESVVRESTDKKDTIQSIITVSVSDGGISMTNEDFVKLMQAIHVNISDNTSKTKEPAQATNDEEKVVDAITSARMEYMNRKYNSTSYTKMLDLYKKGVINGREAANALGVSHSQFCRVARNFGVQKRSKASAVAVMPQ